MRNAGRVSAVAGSIMTSSIQSTAGMIFGLSKLPFHGSVLSVCLPRSWSSELRASESIGCVRPLWTTGSLPNSSVGNASALFFGGINFIPTMMVKSSVTMSGIRDFMIVSSGV